MAKKASVKAAARPRITAAVPEASPAINAGGGIRSTPTQELWRNWRGETSQMARQRVIISRFLQEELSFLGYLVTQLPEEALGDGLVPSSESKDADFKRDAVAYFDLWARSNAIDIRRRFDFYTSQHMVGQTAIGDGETLALKVRDSRPEALRRPLTDKSFRALQLQFLTRDQLGNAGNRALVANGSGMQWDDGILFDALDIPRRYRILKQSGAGFAGPTAFEEKPAEAMLHIFADRQFNQRHGTPWIFGGAGKGSLDALDLKAVKKYAAKIRAYFLGAITTATGDVPNSMRSSVRRGADKNADGETVDNERRYLELAGGLALPVLKQGETVNFFTGQEPVSFAELLAEIWNEAVYAMKYPPEYLINLAGLGSASVRLVLRKVAKAHGRIRRMVREQYCQPVWEFVIGDAIERQLLPLVDDWRLVTWKGGIDPSIDAGRDEKAEQEKLRTFTGTVEQYCDALGLDGETVRHNRLDEIADNIAYGKTKGLPWFMCIDALQVQAMTGLATSLGIDIGELVSKLVEVNDGE